MATTSDNSLKPIGALSGQVDFDPDSKLPFEIDWSEWLDTDTIASSSWVVESPLTQPHSAQNTTTTTTVWIAGGVAGTRKKATNHIVTAAGLEEDAVLYFSISNKI